jgi:hypothetical protein
VNEKEFITISTKLKRRVGAQKEPVGSGTAVLAALPKAEWRC